MDRIARFFVAPKRSFFLFGPRGTGKSTLLKKRYPDAVFIDLLNPKIERQYKARPERLYDFVTANPGKTIIIDEVQRAPKLLPVVHALLFENNSIQFILTGSSARKIKLATSDLLGGRASERHLHPFMASELGDAFQLEDALTVGLLPLLHDEPDPIDALHGYMSLYLKEEVKMEGLVRDLDSFSRFLEAISFSHGSLLNVTNVARDCGVKRKTVENYIDVFEDLLLGYRLPIFQKHAKRKLVSHPKFYIFDTGVFQILRPRGPLDVITELNGIALEGLVAQHFHAWCAYSDTPHKLYFWRTSAGSEVDFVIYGPDGLWAFEVKHSEQIKPDDLRSLKAFSEDYPVAKTALLYRGQERIMYRGVLCIPVETFLRDLRPNQDIL